MTDTTAQATVTAVPYERPMPSLPRTPLSPVDGQPLEVVGIKEIGARLGVRQQTVATWKYRHALPAPQWTVSDQPAWDWQIILTWARQTGRAGIWDAAQAPQGDEHRVPVTTPTD